MDLMNVLSAGWLNFGNSICVFNWTGNYLRENSCKFASGTLVSVVSLLPNSLESVYCEGSTGCIHFYWSTANSGHTDRGFAVKRVDAQGWWAMWLLTYHLLSFFLCFSEVVWSAVCYVDTYCCWPELECHWAAHICWCYPPALTIVSQRASRVANGSPP